MLYGAGHICSGTIISNFTVLTSASCLLKNASDGEFYEAGDLKVAMGSLNRFVEESTTFYTTVKAVKPHGRFNRRTYANNLAILEVPLNETFMALFQVLTFILNSLRRWSSG